MGYMNGLGKNKCMKRQNWITDSVSDDKIYIVVWLKNMDTTLRRRINAAVTD